MGSQAAADITLYTNHRCPWAHRAHIVLAELGIPHKEEIIDLDVPRTAEYLKVNPKGKVPTLVYNGEVIPESAIVARFLVDAYPSHLLPSESDSKGPVERAKIALFVETWSSYVQPFYGKAAWAKSDADGAEAANALVAAIEKEIEPLLAEAGPFFGGRQRISLAEVLVAPFVVRLVSYSKHGLLPASFSEQLQKRAPAYSKWAQELSEHPSVTSIYKEQVIVDATLKKRAQLKAA